MRSSLLAFFAASVLAAPQISRAADLTPASIWLRDFAAAQAEAEKLHRPLVAHFHGKSCGPCRVMEREVLHTPQVLKVLHEGFVAVKVDLDDVRANAKLQSRFHVEYMPTDIILSPEGKVLSRTSQNPGLKTYLETLGNIDAKYVAERKRLSQEATPKSEVATTDPGTPSKASSPPATGSPSKLVPDPVEPQRLDDVVRSEPMRPAETVLPEHPIPVLAIDGYCPVTLRTTRTWKAGQKELSLEHDGQLFYFAEATKRDEFKTDPARYAPRLMGCDPVTLAESDLAIRGSTQFGAFYDGALFLFESSETRPEFRKEPVRYTRLKHVLKPDEIKDVRNVASTTELK